MALLNTLDMRYQMPSRTYLSQVAIPELYKKIRNRVSAELKTVEYFFFNIYCFFFYLKKKTNGEKEKLFIYLFFYKKKTNGEKGKHRFVCFIVICALNKSDIVYY